MASMTAPVTGQKNRFETWAWNYMRWSGILLIPLAFIHLAIMHVIYSVYQINNDFVLLRWSYLGWRLYDAGLLWFAGLHGFNGLRIIINDYVHNPVTNRWLKVASIGLLALIFALGTATLLMAPVQIKNF